jgi:hypothetical protein
VGKPDILLRVEGGGYVPVDVKHYQQFGGPLSRGSKPVSRFSTLERPALVAELPQVSEQVQDHRSLPREPS